MVFEIDLDDKDIERLKKGAYISLKMYIDAIRECESIEIRYEKECE